jgi:hypothetical protein
MRLKEALEKIEDKNSSEELTKKRFACAHCGKTWTELVGLVAGLKEGNEELYLQIGAESEICETCRFRPRACPECGSKDAYEIKFSAGISKEGPLSFEGIRKVSRG